MVSFDVFLFLEDVFQLSWFASSICGLVMVLLLLFEEGLRFSEVFGGQ